jgi:hypothetical protein
MKLVWFNVLQNMKLNEFGCKCSDMLTLGNPIQVGSDTIADFFSDIYFPSKYLAS